MARHTFFGNISVILVAAVLWLGTSANSVSAASEGGDVDVAPEEQGAAEKDTGEEQEGEDSEKAEGEDGESEEGAEKLGSIYIPFKPPLVVNYGGPGRLKYIKADISVRVQDTHAANSVLHHMPYIRNNLVLLFSAQTEQSISSQEGKDALRKEALQEVRDIIKTEDGQEGVVDLYFNAFLIQQ